MKHKTINLYFFYIHFYRVGKIKGIRFVKWEYEFSIYFRNYRILITPLPF